MKQSVTLIINHQVQNWGRDENGTSVMEKVFMNYQLDAPINAVSCKIASAGRISAPYTDFRHFTGMSITVSQKHHHFHFVYSTMLNIVQVEESRGSKTILIIEQ